MPARQALALAEEAGLDLVELSPMPSRRSCKISDYGKFKYQEQKKASEAAKAEGHRDQGDQDAPMIDDHDYVVKMKAIRRFLRRATRSRSR